MADFRDGTVDTIAGLRHPTRRRSSPARRAGWRLRQPDVDQPVGSAAGRGPCRPHARRRPWLRRRLRPVHVRGGGAAGPRRSGGEADLEHSARRPGRPRPQPVLGSRDGRPARGVRGPNRDHRGGIARGGNRPCGARHGERDVGDGGRRRRAAVSRRPRPRCADPRPAVASAALVLDGLPSPRWTTCTCGARWRSSSTAGGWLPR